MILSLDQLQTPEPLLDQSRCQIIPARDLDPVLLFRWFKDYRTEALGASDTPEFHATVQASVEETLEGNHRFALMVDGQPVALAGFNAEVDDTVQIGPVWTPPVHRRQGYARQLLAGILTSAQTRGISRAVLFTNNPYAEKAYAALGFQVNGAYRLCLFKESSMPLRDEHLGTCPHIQ